MPDITLTDSPTAALIAEATRRLHEADRAHAAGIKGTAFDGINVGGLYTGCDRKASYLTAGGALSYAEHMRETAAIYASLADIASRQHPHSPETAQVRQALAQVHQ